MNGHIDANGDDDSTSILSRLQAFMRVQATRTSIANELDIAFSEVGITDAALARVIQVSSMGLLEIKAEVEGIVESLPVGSEERKLCTDVERIEKDRLTEATRKQQLQRILKLSEESHPDIEAESEMRRDMETALRDSEARSDFPSVSTYPLNKDIHRIVQFVEKLNETLQDIRAIVADLAAANAT